MIHGVDLAAMKEAAKTAAMEHFVGKAREDGTPATLRAMYVRKLNAAISTLAGAQPVPSIIAREAEKRGVPPTALAELIVEMAAPSDELELARIDANIAIDASTKPSQIIAVLRDLGLSITMKALAQGEPTPAPAP